MVPSLISAAFAAALLTPYALAEPLGPGFQKITNTYGQGVFSAQGGNEPSEPKPVPRAYIVELNSDAPALSGRGLFSRWTRRDTAHTHFRKRAAEEGVHFQVRQTFTDASLFHGLSLQLAAAGGPEAEAEAKAKLEQLPEVLNVWPVFAVKRPMPAGMERLDLGGSGTSQSQSQSQSQSFFNNSVIRGSDAVVDYNLKMAGVEHLHSKGFRGKGVKIGIIDSGVDYRHPSLGGKFGPGNKIAFGRNYVNDNQTSGPDDPLATCADGGHGTHVAGIIGAEDLDKGFGVLGVAPDATMGMYRVFSCTGTAPTDVVLKAMTDAIADGAQIVSMSLGNDFPRVAGWERADPYQSVIAGAKAKGIVFVISVGNSGDSGPFKTSSPAIGKDAVAVASVDGARYPTTYKMTSNVKGSDEWRYAGLWPLQGEFSVYAAADYEESKVCTDAHLLKARDKVQASGWVIGNTFLMVRKARGCYLPVYQAKTLGFKALLVWRDQDLRNPSDNDYESPSLPYDIISLDSTDGPKLYNAIQANNPETFRLRFSDRRFLAVDNPSAGFTSNYSTMGNTWEYQNFKPLLSAPGHLILSTWPLEAGGYNIISGTSMSTPFVSGCYALLKNAYPQLSFEEITSLFTTTAKPAKWWSDQSIVHTLAHQGAGTINVWDAYNSGLKFAPDTSAITLGQSSAPVTRNITLTNTAGRSQTFEISHEPAGLLQRLPYLDLEEIYGAVYGFPSKPIYADVKFGGSSTTSVTLAAGQSTTVTFTVTPPRGIDNVTNAQYSGHIKFTSASGRNVYSVPYLGVPYVMSEAPLLERGLSMGIQLPAIIQGLTYVNDHPKVIPLPDPDIRTAVRGRQIEMSYWARQPCDITRFDLVAANTTFKPTYYGYNTSRIIETSTPPLPVVESFGGAEILEKIYVIEREPPAFHYFSANIGTRNLGDFRWLMRLLPLNKDPNVLENWVTWLGPIIRFVD